MFRFPYIHVVRIYVLIYIRIYNFIELSSFVRKLLLQRVCDGRETWPYCSTSNRECHKRVGRMIRCTREERHTNSHSYKNRRHVFVRLRTNMRFQACCCVYTCKKAAQCPRGDACTLWNTKVPQLQLQNEGAAKKMPSRETVG